MKFLNFDTDVKPVLQRVNKPGRYAGGEYGAIKQASDSGRDPYLIGVSYPDVYEIGMSNHAVRILYNICNSIPGVRCERVFAPDFDMEAILSQQKIPLYTLESYIPLCELDMIAFSSGFELSATNIMSILQSGNIPLLVEDRSGSDPVIIAGGPGITNPVPFAEFIDFIFIGEAEDVFTGIIESLAEFKSKGAARSQIMEYLQNNDYLYYKGRQKKSKEACGSHSRLHICKTLYFLFHQ